MENKVTKSINVFLELFRLHDVVTLFVCTKTNVLQKRKRILKHLLKNNSYTKNLTHFPDSISICSHLMTYQRNSILRFIRLCHANSKSLTTVFCSKHASQVFFGTRVLGLKNFKVPLHTPSRDIYIFDKAPLRVRSQYFTVQS